MAHEEIGQMIKVSEDAIGGEHDELAKSVRADLQKFKVKAMEGV